jgi:NAD(P)-dependent dehydrogenase (short-subunit alcohol dehydrogenase family)
MENKMNNHLKDKTILITGANSGIGKAAALQLASGGANVVMACRSLERGRQAQQEIIQATGSQDVELLEMDLASQASIRKAAGQFLAMHERLDVLIHNAANFDHTLKKASLTGDGVETIFATNHIGPFLLTHLLLDALKRSAPSRIITVASKGLITYPFLNIEFDNLNGERFFNTQHAYYHSKLAQVIFTYDLAERLKDSGVTVNCVRVTNVAIPDERLTHLPRWMLKIYQLKRGMAISPERQAETYVYLAADPEVEKVTGGYWDENNRQVQSNKNSYNRETWQRLWEVSEKLARLTK